MYARGLPSASLPSTRHADAVDVSACASGHSASAHQAHKNRSSFVRLSVIEIGSEKCNACTAEPPPHPIGTLGNLHRSNFTKLTRGPTNAKIRSIYGQLRQHAHDHGWCWLAHPSVDRRDPSHMPAKRRDAWLYCPLHCGVLGVSGTWRRHRSSHYFLVGGLGPAWICSRGR